MFYDVNEAKRFFAVLSDRDFGNLGDKLNDGEDPVWFGVLFARRKYLSESDGVDMPSSLKLREYVIDDFDRFVRRVSQLRTDRFIDRSGNPIPMKALALYVSLNPRSGRAVTKNLIDNLVDIMYRNDVNAMNRLIGIAYRTYHKTSLKCGRAVIDIDIEFDDCNDYGVELREVKEYCLSEIGSGLKMIVKTHGGFHVYIDLTKIDNRKKGYLFTRFTNDLSGYLASEGISVSEVKLSTDTEVSVAGAVQGGSHVKIVWMR